MSKQALYVPGKADFKQPDHGQGGTSSKKNPGKLGFKQPSVAAGKTSSKKNPGKVGFAQPDKGQGGKSTKKNPGKVGFAQPNPAKKSVSTGIKGKAANVGPKMGKAKGSPKVAPPMPVPKGGFKSVDKLTAARKKHYGV